MITRRLIAGLSLAIACVVSASMSPTAAQCEVEQSGSVGYVTSHFLVRLAQPLDVREPDGTISANTGFPALDALILQAGVQRIESALRVSTRAPKQPERLKRYALDRIYRFHVSAGSDIPALVEAFARLPEVEIAEPDYIDRASSVPDDPQFVNQWAFDQDNDADVDGPEGWDIATGQGVLIAVLDSGIDATHPEFEDRLEPGYDFVNDDNVPEDDASHGTRTSSIIAARTNNIWAPHSTTTARTTKAEPICTSAPISECPRLRQATARSSRGVCPHPD